MKVRVNISQDKIQINETFTGNTADDIVAAVKTRLVRELPFALRLVAGGMSNLMFAQEVVRRYNAQQKRTLPLPNSCAEFLQLAQQEGFATVEEA